MTEVETAKLLDVIDTYYARNKIADKAELKMIIALWHNSFKDFEFSVVFNLLQQHIEVGVPFAPKISDLKDIYFKSLDTTLSSGEAWDTLMRNVRKYGNYHVQEGLSLLDELTIKALNSIGGYSYLCLSEDTMSDRARFLENYKVYTAREREAKQIGSLQDELVQLVKENEHGKITDIDEPRTIVSNG